jgi:hypothetical protein
MERIFAAGNPRCTSSSSCAFETVWIAPRCELRVFAVNDPAGPPAQRREAGVNERAEIVRVQHGWAQAQEQSGEIENRAGTEAAALS